MLQVLSEAYHSPFLLHVSQIPGFDGTFVSAAEQEVARSFIPADNIDIAPMGSIDPGHTLASLGTHIPNLNTLISRTRRENSGFGRTPLQIFDA